MSYFNPYAVAGQMVGQGLNSNATGMVAAKQQIGQIDNQQNPGMTMQTAPAMDRGASDVSAPGQLFHAMDPINSKMNSATMTGIKAEADLYAPVGPTTAGFALQPLKVDSSQGVAPSFNSKMNDYLNYMKYRGGGK
jgi:hypothetical protein